MEKFKYSWNARTPMTSPDMVAKQIKWTPMNEEWKKNVQEMQLFNEKATAYWLTDEMKHTLKALHDKILSFGGDEVLLNQRDDDAELILNRGQFFYGSKYFKKWWQEFPLIHVGDELPHLARRCKVSILTIKVVTNSADCKTKSRNKI